MKSKPTTKFTEMCSKCKYPNLAAEIHKHRYHYSTFSEHANITDGLLEAFLNGEADLTKLEITSLVRTINNLTSVRCDPDYLLAPVICCYEPTNPKHHKKIRYAYNACKNISTDGMSECYADEKQSFLNLFGKEDIDKCLFTRANINAAYRFIEFVNLALEAKTERCKPRRGLTPMAEV